MQVRGLLRRGRNSKESGSTRLVMPDVVWRFLQTWLAGE